MLIGVIGLGRMGANIVRSPHAPGPRVHVYDHNPEPPPTSPGLVATLRCPAGLDQAAGGRREASGFVELSRRLQGGDTIIDGGGTFWKDDISALRKGFGDHVEPREV